MKWNQIESKWALMTRRIRADFDDDRKDTPELSGRFGGRRDAPAPKIAQSQAAAGTESELKTTAK